MAPGGNYHNATNNINDPSIVCPHCGATFRQSKAVVITYTGSSSKEIFKTKTPKKNRPQDLNKTHYWKQKNKPKF